MHNLKIPRFVRFLGLIFLGVFILAIGLFPNKGRAANEFYYSIDVQYSVPKSGPTNVLQTYNVTNNSSNKYLDSIKISAPSNNVQNLRVYYVGGGSIPFTTQVLTEETSGFKYEYTQINIDFPVAKVGQGLRWGFVVDYQTNSLVENKGRANVVYIPGISQENRDSYSVSLKVPDTFGQVHGFGKLPKEVSRQGGIVTYKFEQNDLINNSLQLLFGNSTTYKVGFVFPLNNNSPTPRTFDVALPPNTESQSVFLQNIDPQPSSTRLDGDGNIIASFKLSPNQKLDVKADILADVKYLQYDLAKSGTSKDIPNNLVKTYTQPTRYWQSDNAEINAKAKELTEGKSSVADQIKAINKYVIDTLEYNNEKIKYNIRQGALKAYQDPANVVCLEYSDLSIALLRAAKIPARMPVGYGYSGDLKLSPSVSDSLHSWVEAYVPNVGWVNLDPTWGEKFNNLGISDIDHLAFAIWGASDSNPIAVSAGGQDANYQYEQATISYVTEVPSPSKDSELSATKWVLFPFVSLIQYQAKGPSNSATFDLQLSLGEGRSSLNKELGSTAPAQRISGLALLAGFGFADKSTSKLIEGKSTILASAPVQLNYLPMILVILVITIIIVLVVIKLLSKSHKKSPQQRVDNEQQKIQK
jgi:transglutaminase-like putative cysteine protease